MTKEKVAGKTEVLETLTEIMRRDDDCIKVSETIKAAELIGKAIGIFSDNVGEDRISVNIIDNIPGGKNK